MEKKEAYKKYIEENEEIRSWFKVTSNRKKVWNVQLWIIEEVKKICKKHNIKYYADWGTMLWAIRHWWYIPWDDDVDLVMFREDYEKFLRIAPKELPSYLKTRNYYMWFTKIVNVNTSAFWWDNRWDKDFFGWIRIDIFPLDYASRFSIINKIKKFFSKILIAIIFPQKSYESINHVKRNKFISQISKHLFGRVDWEKIRKMYQSLNKNTLFKWDNVYKHWHLFIDFPSSIYKKSYEINFENITINVPDNYDTYLKRMYWEYMNPVIYPWWHNCRYSVDKSYKDVIKSFNKSRSNEDNYNSCKDLFSL